MKVLIIAFVFAGIIIALDTWCDRKRRKAKEENSEQKQESV